MTEIPTNMRLSESMNTLLIGKVTRVNAIEQTEEILIRIKINLYLAVLSRMTPKTKEPMTPVKINIPPKSALLPEEKP